MIIRNTIWGVPLLLLILLCGIYYTVSLHLIQFKLHKSFALMRRKSKAGSISTFQSVCTTISSTIGTGNIVGVASSITLGGVGALFWMAVSAFFGMAIKYAEAVLAVKYRKQKDNAFIGGPFYYIRVAMKGRPILSNLFAVAGIMSAIWGIGATIQAKSFVGAIDNMLIGQNQIFLPGGNSIGIVSLITLLLACLIISKVLSGGIKRIGRVTSILMPMFAGAYILFTSAILINNIYKLPSAIISILTSALGFNAVSGGVAGYMIMLAMQNGIARGIFSNEAGLGSSPIAIAAVEDISPNDAGYSNMIGPFLDTLCICMLTGMCIVVTGANGANLHGIELTALAFERGLSLPYGIGNIVVCSCLALFSFTTIIGWSYYGEACTHYLFGKKAIAVYKRIYIIAAILSPLLSAEIVWPIADIFNGCMAIPNILALILLSNQVIKEYKLSDN